MLLVPTFLTQLKFSNIFLLTFWNKKYSFRIKNDDVKLEFNNVNN